MLDTQKYWEDRLGLEYSLLGVGDITLGLAYNTWLYRVRGRIFNRILKKTWPDKAPKRVLDVGSGTGFYLNLWQQAGATELSGSDLTKVATTQLARQFPKCRIKQLDISGALPQQFEQGAFDAVSVFDVLFHIVDDDSYRKAVSNLGKLLHPGGYLLYSDNFMQVSENIEHQSSRKWEVVLSALQDAGLQVVGRYPMFVLMNDPVRSSSRILRRMFQVVTRLVRRGERWGWGMGALMYIPELLLTSIVCPGPSTEILVCKKLEK
jgi:SAM-dependent methyltransferase